MDADGRLSPDHLLDLREGVRRALSSAAFWLLISFLAAMLPAPGEELRLHLPSPADLLTPDLVIYASISFLSGVLRRTLLAPVLSTSAGAYLAAVILQMPGSFTATFPGGVVEVDVTPLRDILAAWALLDSVLWAFSPLERSLLRRDAGG